MRHRHRNDPKRYCWIDTTLWTPIPCLYRLHSRITILCSGIDFLFQHLSEGLSRCYLTILCFTRKTLQVSNKSFQSSFHFALHSCNILKASSTLSEPFQPAKENVRYLSTIYWSFQILYCLFAAVEQPTLIEKLLRRKAPGMTSHPSRPTRFPFDGEIKFGN